MSLNTIRAEYGGDFFADTAPHAGEWQTLVAISDDVVIATATMPNFTGEAALTGVRLAQGQAVFGYFTSVTLTSGTVQMVKY